MTESITDLATSLGEQIAELPEYDEYMEALEEYENNEDAQERLSKVRQLENEIIARHQRDEPHEEHAELHEELEEAQEELYELPVVEEYFDAAETLEERLAEVNETISEDLRVNFAQAIYG